ncbi:MAG: GNAT family N-acetyltransferase [Xanthomonadaceae bacterium]|jgi:hypothetical protein|nr:GNAT family N-acetyltransferase [Xanthomonadaceae bacterium]
MSGFLAPVVLHGRYVRLQPLELAQPRPSKLLLPQHAFESMRCDRVELHTHWLNHRSRAAIERLGAKPEGVLRQHQIASDGSVRDSAMYSIVASEWPAVKHHLQFQLDSHSS